MGFSTAHLDVISEPQRPVSLTEAVLAGQHKLWSWGSKRSLHVSLWETSAHVQNADIALSLIFSSLSNTGEFATSPEETDQFIITMADEQVNESENILGLFSFPSYLFISPSRSDWSDGSEGYGVYECVCVFKVEKLCLAGTIKHMDRGEDG